VIIWENFTPLERDLGSFKPRSRLTGMNDFTYEQDLKLKELYDEAGISLVFLLRSGRMFSSIWTPPKFMQESELNELNSLRNPKNNIYILKILYKEKIVLSIKILEEIIFVCKMRVFEARVYGREFIVNVSIIKY